MSPSLRAIAPRVAGLVLFGACTAAACPTCDSPTGAAVREGIFGNRFGRDLALTLAPFGPLAALVMAAGRAPRRRSEEVP